MPGNCDPDVKWWSQLDFHHQHIQLMFLLFDPAAAPSLFAVCNESKIASSRQRNLQLPGASQKLWAGGAVYFQCLHQPESGDNAGKKLSKTNNYFHNSVRPQTTNVSWSGELNIRKGGGIFLQNPFFHPNIGIIPRPFFICTPAQIHNKLKRLK